MTDGKVLCLDLDFRRLISKYSRSCFLATTELFIESGNVCIETKRGPLYSFFDASLRGCIAGKSGLVLTWLGLRIRLGFGLRLRLKKKT
jgi:hypothetical protein